MDEARAFRERLFEVMRAVRCVEGATQGVTRPESRALTLLLDRERASQDTLIGDLVARLHITQPNVSRLCARLEARGLLERRPCHEDRRAKTLGLTESGRAMSESLERQTLERYSSCLETLPAEQLPMMFDLLDALARGLTQELPPCSPCPDREG